MTDGDVLAMLTHGERLTILEPSIMAALMNGLTLQELEIIQATALIRSTGESVEAALVHLSAAETRLFWELEQRFKLALERAGHGLPDAAA